MNRLPVIDANAVVAGLLSHAAAPPVRRLLDGMLKRPLVIDTQRAIAG